MVCCGEMMTSGRTEEPVFCTTVVTGIAAGTAANGETLNLMKAPDTKDREQAGDRHLQEVTGRTIRKGRSIRRVVVWAAFQLRWTAAPVSTPRAI